MDQPPIAFAGSIPEHYERHLRPVLFEPYAEDLASRTAGAPGPHLELACGTGVLTRQLLARMGSEARLTATDLNPPMLEEARQRLAEDPRLSWERADMTALPFGDGAFGTVVCQFGFMFPPDKAAAFRESRRVLRPGGRLLFNVWGSLEDNPANPATLRALERLFPEDPPTFLEVPFGFHDGDRIQALLEEQGFAGVRLEALVLPCRCESAATLAAGLVRGTPLANDLLARDTEPEAVIGSVTAALAEVGGEAPFTCPMKALVVEAQAV